VIDVVLLSFLVLTALAFAAVRNLFAVVMLSGMFSLTAALLYVVMDAVDVAFTEAAVGAGIATVLGLATLALIGVAQE
jgi:multicomponent Na+:H+ antiporter subunit B